MARPIILVAVVAVLATGLLALPALPVRASPLTIFTGVPLVVSNPLTNQVIDVANGSFGDAAVQTYPFRGKANQNWKIRPRTVDSRTYWYLVAAHSGKCLDVQWGSHDPGAPLWQWPCNYGDAQLWMLEPAGATADRFGVETRRLVNKGSGMCLTVPTPANPQGIQLQQRPCVASSQAQDWQFTHPLISETSPVVLTVEGALSFFNRVNPRAFDGSPAQDLQLLRVRTDGAFRVQGSTGCLRPTVDIIGWIPPGIGTSLSMTQCSDSDATQVWRATSYGTGLLGETEGNIRNDAVGLCLSFDPNVAPEQAALTLQPCGNFWNQRWLFYVL
jgi:hypothetical protein